MPIKKVDLSAIGTKPSGSKKSYPALPVTPEMNEHLKVILKNNREIEVIEADTAARRAELIPQAMKFLYEFYRGKTDIESSLEAKTDEGDSMLFTMANRYRGLPDESPIVDLIGEARTTAYFSQSVEIKVNGDKVPLDNLPVFVAELTELCARHNASGALTSKAVIKPSPEFHTARHTAFTPEENIALDSFLAPVVSIKTKGRK